MNNYPSSEKPLHLISMCLNRQYVDISEVMDYFNCSYKQASRLMDKVRDMQFELGYYWCEVTDGERGENNPRKKIQLKLVDKYLTGVEN